MDNLAIKMNLEGQLEEVVRKVTAAIQPAGFGILTRIDFDKKIFEKTGERIAPVSILGACNPKLALEAYRRATDTALLIPCNIAVTQISDTHCRVEAIRPTKMLEMLPELDGGDWVRKAESELEKCLKDMGG